MKSTILTHIGKRKTNQDLAIAKQINSDSFLYLIADGMGGYDNGDIAASIVVESIVTFLTNTNQLNEEAIEKAINKANLALRQYQEKHNSKLGSTLGGIIVSGKTALAFWVGDVKILQYSNGKLSFESKPHNLINELSETVTSINRENISKFEHIVTRSIQGDVKKSIPSYKQLILNKEDNLFICSDGVHNLIDAISLQYLINKEYSINSLLETIDRRLTIEANDNASLIAINGFNLL